MLNLAVQERARQLISERIKLRDDQLSKDFERLAGQLQRADGEEDKVSRLAVKLRLLCEEDQNQRAQLIWQALKAAHHDVQGYRVEGLIGSLKTELNEQMRAGGIRLAEGMRDHAEPLAEILTGKHVISADWLARRRDHAAERMGKQIDDYVVALRWSFAESLKRWMRKK